MSSVTIKYYIHTRHDIPFALISLNRLSRHLSVDGQVVVRTCQSGSLKYHKYQCIESEVEDYMEKWLAKKLVATMVSSREVDMKRRGEGKTIGSQKNTETHKCQRDEKRTGNRAEAQTRRR